MAVAQLPGDVASLCKCPERDAGDTREFYVEEQARPKSIADFRNQAARSMVFEQSNNDSNNSAQVCPSQALRQHFSSQAKLTEDNEWARQVSPPYRILDNQDTRATRHHPPTLTTPILKLGRSERDKQSRSLTCGANPVDFTKSITRDVRPVGQRKPGQVPGADRYHPNYNSVMPRVQSLTDMEKNPRGTTQWNAPGYYTRFNPTEL